MLSIVACQRGDTVGIPYQNSINECSLYIPIETYLRLWCDTVGIPYQDSMVNWRPMNGEQLKEFEPFGDWVTTRAVVDTMSRQCRDNRENRDCRHTFLPCRHKT